MTSLKLDWNPTQHHDDMMEHSPGVLNAFNIEVTECQPHCEPVLDTMANALVDENNLSDMQAWHDHRVISHEDGTFCTDMWDINPFGTINTDGTFFTDAWDKDPTWMAENFQVNALTVQPDTETDEFVDMSDLHTRGSHSFKTMMMGMTLYPFNNKALMQPSTKKRFLMMRWMTSWKT